MSLLLNCQKLSKSYRSIPLFQNLSFSVEEGERVGVVGPNGAGKSTLMKIISGKVEPDEGKITNRKDMRVCYLPQEDEFEERQIYDVLFSAAKLLDLEAHELKNRVEKQLSKFSFDDPAADASTLSGGWRKRLAIARAMIQDPDLLLLDEPTNHLDLDGVIWLEKLLQDLRCTLLLISHDRQFLENLSTRIIEISPVYEDGCLSVNGAYSDFLLARQEYLTAQAHLEQSLASKVRREVAWLKRGARARQTKSTHRIREAGQLIDTLQEVKARNTQNTKVDIDFDATGRRSKELLVAKDLAKTLAGRNLFSNLNIVLQPGSRIGLIGANGSGKTTLIKILTGELQPDQGNIKRADGLRIVCFDQNREQLDQSQSLWKSLCPEGDSVAYRDRKIHVSTWARRFLFKQEQLKLPISYLSGGEQARILIANLMKQPADLLILDEPTNNLDLPSLEVLEESLLEFPGAIVLVTHDRYMIHEVPNLILSLDGKGKASYFADYSQWEEHAESLADNKIEKEAAAEKLSRLDTKERKGLSTSEKKELAEIAEKIEKAEKELKRLQEQMHDPAISSNHEKLVKLQHDVDLAQGSVEKLYKRWEDLELRQESASKT